MKLKLLCLLSLMLLAVGALGQTQQSTGSISANGVCLPFRTQNNSTVGIIVSGTWTGTLTPNVQIVTTSGAPTVAKKVLPVDGSAAQATITANGGFLANVAGFTQFNVCSTAWTSGTAVVTVYSTPAPNNSTIAAGSGGLPTGLAFASPEFDISSAGNGNGVLGLAGNTSGIAKFTAPAVAGTATNPIGVSNSLSLQFTGTAAAPNLALFATNNGIHSDNNGIYLDTGGAARLQANASAIFPVVPICDNSTGNNCLTFSNGKISVTGSGKPPFILASTTVASLPAASSNTGGVISVSDSTAIATEGQTCAGSSTNTALAFSNGTVWKCF